jgi:hypothetical protein
MSEEKKTIIVALGKDLVSLCGPHHFIFFIRSNGGGFYESNRGDGDH